MSNLKQNQEMADTKSRTSIAALTDIWSSYTEVDGVGVAGYGGSTLVLSVSHSFAMHQPEVSMCGERSFLSWQLATY